MSEYPPGPGYWQASDGRWYPPESHPGAQTGIGYAPGYPPGPAPAPRTEGLAIASLVLGIVNFIICPLVGAIGAIVTGVGAKRRIRDARGELGGDGLAIAGIVLGIIGIIVDVGVVLLILAISVFGTSASKEFSRVSSITVAPTTPAPTGSTPVSVAVLPAPANAGCPDFNGRAAHYTRFSAPPPSCLDPNKTYTVTFVTDAGTFAATLDQKAAPKTANNFAFLAGYHFFDGIVFHRVIPGFVIQGGDPTGTGTGGPGYEFGDELPGAGQYRIGSLAMANAGPNTNGSQFFIITGDQGVALPPSYPLFGQVTQGLNVVKKIEADGTQSGQPALVHIMISVTVSAS